MPRKPGLNSEFIMFDVVYEDGTQRSNRKVPRALTGGIDGDKPAHGFLIEQTNINSMLVPGYISVLPAKFDTPGEHLMPCQEFCGIGHEGMWAKLKVIDKTTFFKMAADKRRLTCVE